MKFTKYFLYDIIKKAVNTDYSKKERMMYMLKKLQAEIDTILNRVDCDKFDDTVEGVIYAENQFSVMTNGRFERCSVQDKFVKLVEEELLNRTNSDVLFFRASYYHSFGTPLVAYGNTYFSTY